MNDRPAQFRITDLQASERPRERLAKHGAQVLTNAELLAILLRTGRKGENAVLMGQRLLHDLKGLQGILGASFGEVCRQSGVGPAKAAQIKAAMELGHRLAKEELKDRPVIDTPQSVFNLVWYEMMTLEQEHLRVILLDTRNRVLGVNDIYHGSLNSSQVRTGEIFKYAIRENAASVIIVHNHPSGDPTPSPDDVAVTRAIVQAGKLLDIQVLDHLVVANQKYVSLKERGLGFG